MAYRNMAVTLGLILASLLCSGAMAQSSSCTNVLISMSPCLNYITGNSSTPSSQCCRQLSSVVRSSPQCLCEVLNSGGSSLGINVNRTQAIALPRACNVQTPPISRCNAASPAESPSATTAEVPTATNPGSGSKTVPSTGADGSSDGSSIKLSIPILAFFFAASYSLIFMSY